MKMHTQMPFKKGKPLALKLLSYCDHVTVLKGGKFNFHNLKEMC